MDALPPRHITQFLLSHFFTYGTDCFFYVDQSQFQRDIDQFYTEKHSPLRTDPAFVCLLSAALALGSVWTRLAGRDATSATGINENIDVDPGRIFFTNIQPLLPEVLERSCLRSIQTTYILGVYRLPASAIGSSYLYLGISLRKAIAARLHQKTTYDNLSEREGQICRRLFWSIYALERQVTVYAVSWPVLTLLQHNRNQDKSSTVIECGGHNDSAT